MSRLLQRLVYLYIGSVDVTRDVDFYLSVLGAELAWRRRGFGAEVAAVRLGDGPLVLLADHRPARSIIQIWAVADLDAMANELRAAGWAGPARRVEVPDGPCLLLEDPSGNEIGLLQQSRLGILDGTS